MIPYVAVFIGGGFGSVARFLVSKYTTSNFQNVNPYATLISNVTSTLILGLILYYFAGKYPINESIKLLLIVGFCGGFSTFSTFSFEIFELLRASQYLFAFLNIFVSLILGLGVLFIVSKIS